MKNILDKKQAKTPYFFKKEKGATMVEYAIMLAMLTIVSLAVITSLGQSVSATFSTVNSTLTTTG
ncbi:Flp family type IVb pilin [Methylobacter svalbardensis]|uniref:Flp family type IVb pilin n=1 Tax=Methylobacter svalbardensis TaxID=3080016 RepID=UPI0030ED91FA